MTNITTAQQFSAVHERLMDAFQKQAALRNELECQKLVDTADGPELAWVLLERYAMCDEVNQIRLVRGEEPVLLKEIEKLENLATGHVDYASKWTLYCAELALSIKRHQ